MKSTSWTACPRPNRYVVFMYNSHAHPPTQPIYPNNVFAALCAFARMVSTCSSRFRIWVRAARSSAVNWPFSSRSVVEEGDEDPCVCQGWGGHGERGQKGWAGAYIIGT